MKEINKMQLKLPALSANEGMARATVAAFCSQLDPAAVEEMYRLIRQVRVEGQCKRLPPRW